MRLSGFSVYSEPAVPAGRSMMQSLFKPHSAFARRNRHLEILDDRETIVVRDEFFRFMTDRGCGLDRVRGPDAVSGAQVRGGLGDIRIERHHGEVRKLSQQIPGEGEEPRVIRLSDAREDLVERQDGRHRPEPPRLDLLEQILREGNVFGVFLEVINENIGVQADHPLPLRSHPDRPPGAHSQDSRSRRRKRSAPPRERQASFPRPRKAFAKLSGAGRSTAFPSSMVKYTVSPSFRRSAFRISFGTVTWHFRVRRLDFPMGFPPFRITYLP